VRRQALRPKYFTAQLQLTDACNLACAHCYNANPPVRRVPKLDEILLRIDRIFAFCRRRELPEPDIHLSGGEPTVRRDLPEIVERINAHKRRGALLFTNGTLWAPSLSSALRKAGLTHVQISLEGPEAFTDAVRGEGVYRDAMRTLRMLHADGFALTVSITVTANNVSALPAFVEELDPLGLHFHLREVLPQGAGKTQPGLDREQRRRLFAWAMSHRGSSTVGLEDPTCCSVSAHARSMTGCVAGWNHFCVDVEGDVYPCRPLAVRVGHVGDLDAAWDSPVMKRLRARDVGGACKRCQLRAHCGGCRVFALANGDLYGEDPRCFAAENDLIRTPLEATAISFAHGAGRLVRRLVKRRVNDA
jgi:pyrroloquinoline quinone biosynthesis protein E